MRLIDADALNTGVALFMAENAYLNMTALDALKMVAEWIQEAPTIEAEPVRHGEWRIFKDGCVLLAECSECGTVQSGIAAAQWDYCPMCGCRMDGGADNDQA